MFRPTSEILKKKRKQLRMSITDIIEKLKEYGFNISTKTLYGYESGHREPNSDIFMALCSIYEMVDILNEFRDTAVTQTNSKIYNFYLESPEQTHIEKYRALDERGKQTIDTLLDIEYSRIDPAKAVKEKLANTEKPAVKTDADIALEEESAAFAEIARQQYLAEKKPGLKTSSAKRLGAG